ncbi:hypothetical protein [Billgrantia antri]|uniref:DUF2459 domain-containing protein n=1 Tax=Billgrantia antri TaxID=2846777 RepID=A0ABS6ZMA9_9GAMM|nr:hypothetical protein [Halomonas antri]MBW6391212.1 hypothetical protein [Halomonas antri]
MGNRRGWLRWLGAGLSMLLLAGCFARVMPPEPHSLTRPVDVYLLDHGRHSSLVLPREEGGVVRYSYGEWRWYVEGHRHFSAGIAAMLWPTASGLGRGEYPRIESPDQFHRLAPEGLDEVYPLRAEARRVLSLRRRLDRHFERAGVEPVSSEEFGLEFVPYPRRYSAVHQSNLVVARWLRALDMEVLGSSWWSRWRLETP